MLPVIRNGKEETIMRLNNCAAVEMKSVRNGGKYSASWSKENRFLTSGLYSISKKRIPLAEI